MTNILLIDQHLPDSSVFVDSCNETTVPFLYSQDTTREQLLQFLQQTVPNSQIQRLCFAFEIKPNYIFLNNEPLFEIENMCINTNTQFLINIIQQYNILNVDFLACESLLDNNWSTFYKLLTENTKVIVGASNNKTGNLLFGGDWVMESTNTDIELIYFNKSIEYYKYLLGSISQHTVFIINGIIYGCGSNGNGQLGDGTFTNRSTLVQMINNTGKTPVSVSYGSSHTVVLMTDGTIYGCGYNYSGQLGNNSTTNSSLLVLMTIPTGKTPVSVSCGSSHTVVLMTDGTIYGCGYNYYGQLGDGTNINRNTLVQTVAKTTPLITNFPDLTKPYVSSPFSFVIPSSNSDGSFSYTSSNLSVAIVSGSQITILSVGTTTITVNQEETSNYLQGTKTLLLTVNKANPVLTNFSNITKTYGSSPFPITNPTSNSDGSFSYYSYDLGVASINSSTVTIIAAGTTQITATQASTSNYNSGTKTLLLTVDKANPTFGEYISIEKTNGQVSFDITAPASNSSGLFSYTSSNLSVATVSGSTVTIVAAGTSTITVNQASTDNYTSGTIELQMTINPSTLLNPTEIINDNTLLFFQNTSAVYGNIISSIEVSQNLTATSQKILFTTNGSKTITSANK